MNESERTLWRIGERQYALVRFFGSVNDKLYLFECTADTLQEGDVVKCETVLGEKYGIAAAAFDGRENTAQMKAIMMLTGATLPLKRIIGKARLEEIEYPEEEEK